MIQSMTGYAAVAAETHRGRLGLELRSVNSRFLDLQLRLADDLRGFEPLLRERVTGAVSRGKVDCRLFFNAAGGTPPAQRLNAEALARLRELAQEARRSFPEAAPLGAADVLRWPGVLAEEPVDEERLRIDVERLCAQALRELVAARAREGERLAAAVRERTSRMRERLQEALPLLPEAIAAYQARLAERLREALGSADDERLRAEVASFAAKADVDEELTRLATHLGEVERTIEVGGAVGKRLDFLAQELNREANTFASKAASQKLSDCALELKLLVEQVREQVQNIE